jgi:hypothetical protein
MVEEIHKIKNKIYALGAGITCGIGVGAKGSGTGSVFLSGTVSGLAGLVSGLVSGSIVTISGFGANNDIRKVNNINTLIILQPQKYCNFFTTFCLYNQNYPKNTITDIKMAHNALSF